MDKYFLLVFSLLCFIKAVTPLRCIKCHLRWKTDRCQRRFGVCIAQENEAYMMLQIYRDSILQLSYLVCQKFCRNLTFHLNNQTYVHKCCNHNYCNFKI